MQQPPPDDLIRHFIRCLGELGASEKLAASPSSSPALSFESWATGGSSSDRNAARSSTQNTRNVLEKVLPIHGVMGH